MKVKHIITTLLFLFTAFSWIAGLVTPTPTVIGVITVISTIVIFGLIIHYCIENWDKRIL